MITKKEKLNIAGLAIAFIVQIFLILSAQYSKTNTVIAYGFLVLAYVLLFIVFAIIFPKFWKEL